MRRYFYNLLEQSHSSALARLLNILLMLLIIGNVFAVILASDRAIYLELQTLFDHFELLSIAIFTMEYLLRAWVCVEDPRYQSAVMGRLKYLSSPMAIVDLVAVLPFYLGVIFNIDARILRVLRLFRIFKLSRHFSAMSVLLTVIRTELPTLVSAIFIMLVLVVLASAGMFLVERDVQPQTFGTIPRAMWWATITLTTVGYGDVIPVTAAGKVLGIFITILGVGMAALPAGIIASGFNREVQKRKDAYRSIVRNALKDGRLDRTEHRELKNYSTDMGIDHEEALHLLAEESTARSMNIPASPDLPVECPYCGKAITSPHSRVA
ncbi:MAG: ion transporter [Gammaproteobacteria bacterium]|nr:ion transporter [Gammaproteobacteria bacterium]